MVSKIFRSFVGVKKEYKCENQMNRLILKWMKPIAFDAGAAIESFIHIYHMLLH